MDTPLSVKKAYALFKRLCKKLDIAPYALCKRMRISYTTPYRWRTAAVKTVDTESETKLLKLAREYRVRY